MLILINTPKSKKDAGKWQQFTMSAKIVYRIYYKPTEFQYKNVFLECLDLFKTVSYA